MSNNDGSSSNHLFNFTSYRSFPETSSSSSSSLDEPLYRGLALTQHALEPPTLQSFQQSNNWWQTSAQENQQLDQSEYNETNTASNILSGKNSYQSSNGKTELFNYTTLLSSPSLTRITLKDEPSYIERYTSFYSLTDTSSLISSVSTALSSLSLTTNSVLSVHYELTQDKAKFKCVGYDTKEGGSVEMIVRIYRASNDDAEGDRKVVEFQRRCGCVVTFNRIYSQLVHMLQEVVETTYTGVVRTAPSISSSVTFSPIVPTGELLSIICSMISTDEYCSILEACSLLSTCSFSSLATSDATILVDLLSKCVVNGDEAIERYSAVALTALVQAHGGQLLTRGLNAVFTALNSAVGSRTIRRADRDDCGDLHRLMTVRALALCLCVGSVSPLEITGLIDAMGQNKSGFMHILSKCEVAYNDAETSELVREARHRFEVC